MEKIRVKLYLKFKKNMNGQKIDCLLFIVPQKLFINI